MACSSLCALLLCRYRQCRDSREGLSLYFSREREASAELVLQPEKVEAHRSALDSPHTLPPRPGCCTTWGRMIDHHARTGGTSRAHLVHSCTSTVRFGGLQMIGGNTLASRHVVRFRWSSALCYFGHFWV